MRFPTDRALLDRLRSPRPFPHEWMILAYLIAALVLLETMPVTYPRIALIAAYAGPVGVITAIAALVTLLRHRRGGERDVPLSGDLLAIGRIVLLLSVAWATHFLLKSFIFVINPKTWDLFFAVWDQRIHLGFSPSTFFTTLFRAKWFLFALDLVYSGAYFLVVLIYTSIFLGILPLRLKMAFGAAFTLLWVVGSSLYVAMPSWGPVYVFSDEFVNTLRYMPLTVSIQRTLFEEISSLVRNPEALRYVKLGSVAAFPSLHVAVVMLFALASRHISRRWFHANVILMAVMVIGSVVTGYHYLIDGWAGIALAAGLWFATTRYFGGTRAA
ncbi:MAG TPA: phosphatase PAP2 family protein [Thermoanaerobaculia bacterium]|nr:phosphatase PAP2 family protein [Thermoanaerobaculia bacterium]